MKKAGNGVKGAIRDFIDTIHFLVRILSWSETWTPTLVVLAIVAWWFAFDFALLLPDPWKSVIIWGGLITCTPAAVAIIILKTKFSEQEN